MKPGVPDTAPEAPLDRPKTTMIRKRNNARRPPPERMQRQNDILQRAWRHFGAAAPVIAFLNTRHDQLEAQPLHLAVESAEGLQQVQKLLEEMALRA